MDKIITIKDIVSMNHYINEESKKIDCSIKYKDCIFTSHTSRHVDLFFEQFQYDSEGLYWLGKDKRILELGANLIKKDAKLLFENILKWYPEFKDIKNE